MKENVIDVLRYLFEQYMDEEAEMHADRDALTADLSQAGFSQSEIAKALKWLEDLSERHDQHEFATHVGPSIRVYTEDEMDRIDVEARGLLMFLEQCGILDSLNREVVIDRIMALDAEDIDLEELKWVVLMVLFNQPEQDDSFMRMEDFIFDGYGADLH
ncbi:MAG: DUF494 family protein [Gammaproteobacteria bacterium]